MPAPNAGELLVMAFGGQRKDGTQFVTGELLSGGSGAGNGFDGVDAIETDATNCMNLPAERPWNSRRRFASIAGVLRPIPVVPAPGAEAWAKSRSSRYSTTSRVRLSFSHRGERHFVAAQGMSGGGRVLVRVPGSERRDGTTEVIASKLVTRLALATVSSSETAGAGGYGEPARRATAAVSSDIADGKVSGGRPSLQQRKSARSLRYEGPVRRRLCRQAASGTRLSQSAIPVRWRNSSHQPYEGGQSFQPGSTPSAWAACSAQCGSISASRAMATRSACPPCNMASACGPSRMAPTAIVATPVMASNCLGVRHLIVALEWASPFGIVDQRILGLDAARGAVD